jgi:hypothetical protein
MTLVAPPLVESEGVAMARRMLIQQEKGYLMLWKNEEK